MTANGMETVMMIEITVTVKGESGEEEAPTGTGTETQKRETDALVGIETGREILEIESHAERRKKAEERKSLRGQTGPVGTKPLNLPLTEGASQTLLQNLTRGRRRPPWGNLLKSLLLRLPHPLNLKRILAQQQRLLARLQLVQM